MIKYGLFLLLAALLAAPAGAQQLARLQVIHNAADPMVEMVDVYVNDTRLLDDFAFRTATPFIDVPAGIPLELKITPGSSVTPDDAMASFTVTLEGGKTYLAVASGVFAGFPSNPDGRDINFTLLTTDAAVEEAPSSGEVALAVLHGVTDAPAVDVVARGIGVLVDDAAYRDITSYAAVPAAAYTLDITPAADNSTVLFSYSADLTSLGGGAAFVFASGFLDPSANQDGPSFGLYAALPDGTVFPLPELNERSARLQVIHNAADPAAAIVDVYLNGSLLLDDFAFRTATPFVDVPANTNLQIGVAPGNSSSAGDILKTIETSFEAGKTYVAVASGVLDPTAFAANPDGRLTDFLIYATDQGQETGTIGGFVDIAVLHGATDAPTVDVVARNVSILVDDLAYGSFTPYATLPAETFVLEITPGGDNSTVVAAFDADLTPLDGGAAVVFASGFLDPSVNQNGPAFGLYVALPDGTVFPLPVAADPVARLQVIHNAADPAAEKVDVYLDGALLLDDFAFRTATPFVDIPASTDLEIGIAPATSTSAGDIITTFILNVPPNSSYVAMASGVLGGSFAANPDGRGTGFTLRLRDQARESADPGLVAIAAFHGATDAPTVDVIARGVGTLVDDAAFGDFTDYTTVPAADYTLDLTPGNDNSAAIAAYRADLSGLGGGAAMVFASGFLNPAANNDGEPFGLFAALTDGTVIPLATVASTEDLRAPAAGSVAVYPNPALSGSPVRIAFADAQRVRSVRLYDLQGRELYAVDATEASGTVTLPLGTLDLAPGMYRIAVSSGTTMSSTPLQILR